MKAADENQIVWDLLEWGNLEALKKFTPENFDWRALHPTEKNTLLMEGVACGLAGPNEAYLDIIEWLVRSGADAAQRTPPSSQGNYSIWLIEDPDKTKLTVAYKGLESGYSVIIQHSKTYAQALKRTGPATGGENSDFGGHSAISYLLAWKRELQDKAEWSENLAYLDKALARITTATQHIRPVREKVAIDQSVVELWERVLDATASHNLTFETADGPVTAHAHVLMEASPVLKAMLDSSMKEGETRRIQVKDSPSRGVSLFLETLYTCSTRSEPNHETVLIALDLAHRWQVYGVVNIFAELLQEMITDANFAAIAEAAVLKDLEGVKKVCRIHGMESRAVQERLKKGLLPKMLQDLLGHKASPAASCPKKRRRF
ncbi:unnamed protein product [Durusdinium trenchii]|uniref:BTB domain-containing protein n=2 Tax=Durusdinium trenchii TaxID=1381693 RepID=A0ABP0J8C6_9DINO